MTTSNGDQCDRSSTETIELPATDTTQRALHESIGRPYDELAAAEAGDIDPEEVPNGVFDAVEGCSVAAAEESVSTVELSSERTE